MGLLREAGELRMASSLDAGGPAPRDRRAPTPWSSARPASIDAALMDARAEAAGHRPARGRLRPGRRARRDRAGHPGRLHAGGQHRERGRAHPRLHDRPLEALPAARPGPARRPLQRPDQARAAATSTGGRWASSASAGSAAGWASWPQAAFGMRVLYNDIVAPPPEAEARAGAQAGRAGGTARASPNTSRCTSRSTTRPAG